MFGLNSDPVSISYYLKWQNKCSVRIALVSDVHCNDCNSIIRMLVRDQPDYITICGDLLYAVVKGKSLYESVPNSCQNLRNSERVISFLKKAVKISPVLFSTGNHELYMDSKDKELLSDLGVILLDNTFCTFDDIVFGGLSSPYSVLAGTGSVHSKEEHKLRWKMLYDNVETEWLVDFERQRGYKIILCHHPEFYEPYLKMRKGIDLILSGHTHGGQVRFFGNALYAHGQGWFPKYSKGIYDRRLIVSAGLSNTSRIPRINNQTELVYVYLTP